MCAARIGLAGSRPTGPPPHVPLLTRQPQHVASLLGLMALVCPIMPGDGQRVAGASVLFNRLLAVKL